MRSRMMLGQQRLGTVTWLMGSCEIMHVLIRTAQSHRPAEFAIFQSLLWLVEPESPQLPTVLTGSSMHSPWICGLNFTTKTAPFCSAADDWWYWTIPETDRIACLRAIYLLAGPC